MMKMRTKREVYMNLKDLNEIEKKVQECLNEGLTKKVRYFTNIDMPGGLILKFRAADVEFLRILYILKDIKPYSNDIAK